QHHVVATRRPELRRVDREVPRPGADTLDGPGVGVGTGSRNFSVDSTELGPPRGDDVVLVLAAADRAGNVSVVRSSVVHRDPPPPPAVFAPTPRPAPVVAYVPSVRVPP